MRCRTDGPVARGSLACRRRARGLAGILACFAALCGASAPASAATAAAAGDPGSWTVYHGNRAGTGVAANVRSVDTATRAWTSPTLDGQIYGQPLVLGGRVFAATENDTVYALSAATGSVLWRAHLAKPVPAGSLPCGNITPTVGITGTPVIDRSRAEIFVVADELRNGAPVHVLVGLSTATGKRELTEKVDPAGQDPAAILQRTALTLDAGRVVFGFGGNYGDCATYRGRLIAVPEDGGPPLVFTVDAARDESQGAIWLGGGAPAVDVRGNIWVSTGNGSVHATGHAYDHSDGLLELSPSLRLLQYFAPSNWPSNNAQDIDLSTEPVLLPDGQVIVAGKEGQVYLLDGARLGGIGGQQAMLGSACSGDIDGGSAVRGMTAYLPCLSGIIAVRAQQSPPALRLLWSSRTGGGPPIVAAGLIWTIGQDGVLYGLDPATGRVRQHASTGVPANHFPTPGVGAGLLLAACARNVIAFSAPGPGARPTAGRAASDGKADCRYNPPGAGLSRRTMAAIAVGGLAALAALGWLLWRYRRASRAG